MDYAKETHPLYHFILYSKNWFSPMLAKTYQDEELYFDFIRKILYLDGYGSLDKYYTKYDMISNLVNAMDRHNIWLSQHYPDYAMTIGRFMDGVQRNEKWYGMPHNVAIVMTIRDWFSTMDGRMVVLGDVDFNRKMYRMGILNLKRGENYIHLNNRFKKSKAYFELNALKLRFLEHAHKRAEESKGTDYEWNLSYKESDRQDFIDCIETCENPRLNWTKESTWDELIDWYENLPNY